MLTTAEVVQGCERITLDGEVETDVTLLDKALGLAVLAPRTPLAPVAFGAFRNAQPRLNDPKWRSQAIPMRVCWKRR